VLDAKAANMPGDNVKRAIQRGTGELPGTTYEELTMEGYGPGGVAVLIELTTDNRNRTVSEIRHGFGKNGGNLGEAGSVAWMFHKKGDIVVLKSAAKEDDLMNIVLESAFEAVSEALKKANIATVSAEIGFIPDNYIKLEGHQANTMIRLIEALEELDDVVQVYSNFDVDVEKLEEVAG
jgi:transcriptional/translational regulatory protein YebC/TACO1